MGLCALASIAFVSRSLGAQRGPRSSLEPPRLDIAFATAFRRSLASCLLFVAAVVLLFEEWLWEKSTAVAARLGRLPLLSAIESWIRGRERWSALALFVAPVVVIYPFKALALYAMARGYVTGGVMAFILAKLAATAVFARLYQLTEHAIIQFHWVRRTRAAFLRGRAFVHAWLNAQPAYRRARVLIRGSSQRIKHRYRVAYRLQRQRRGAAARASASRAGRRRGAAQPHPDLTGRHEVVHPRWRPGARRRRSRTS
jgi:hypothetical protein